MLGDDEVKYAGRLGERVMIENNRNQINVQSCNARVLCGLSEIITDFRAV